MTGKPPPDPDDHKLLLRTIAYLRMAWSGDEIKRAVDEFDTNRGLRPRRGRPREIDDSAALEYMATIARIEDLWDAETLAQRALDANKVESRYSDVSAKKRLADRFKTRTLIAKRRTPLPSRR